MTDDSTTFDVLFVPKSNLYFLATFDDPFEPVLKNVWPPFPDDPAPYHLDLGVAITVVSLLDVPVQAMGVHTPSGYLRGKPQVRRGGTLARPPYLVDRLDGPGGEDGWGWIDPSGDPNYASVGTWWAHDDDGAVQMVVHLRCGDTDILVGGSSRYRGNPFGWGPWNPYNAKLYDPGALPDAPTEADYARFLQTEVIDGAGTDDDHAGTSASGAVSFLSRARTGRGDTHWHILVILAPWPVVENWDYMPVAAGDLHPAPADSTSADPVDADVTSLLKISSDPKPSAAQQQQIQAAMLSVPVGRRNAVLAAYLQRLG